MARLALWLLALAALLAGRCRQTRDSSPFPRNASTFPAVEVFRLRSDGHRGMTRDLGYGRMIHYLLRSVFKCDDTLFSCTENGASSAFRKFSI